MAARLSATLLRTQTDRRLTALAAGGSEPAFEAIVERYRRPLQAYCRRLLLDGATAEDVVQQAFLSTWQTLRGGTAIADVKPWLYRVVHNGAINALKRSGYGHEELGDALSGSGAPDEDLDRRIAVRRTLAGLAALPELQREALLRTAVEGRSHEQVARELGLTDGAVRGLIYRARATLRSAATVLTPAPFAQWVASWSGRESAPMAERISDLVAGGGSAGAAAMLAKASATVVATGALAGGAVVADRDATRDAVAEPAPPAAHATEPASSDARPPERRPAGPAIAEPIGEDDAPGSNGGPDDDDDDHSGPGRDGDDDARDDDSGPGSGDTADEDHSGPGPEGDDDSRDDDNSGPGSGDTADDDRSGPGGGDDTTVEDNSGSGSRDATPEIDSSGPGSGDDAAPQPTVIDSSGSGSSGSSGSSGPDSSGSGSSGSPDDEPDDDHEEG